VIRIFGKYTFINSLLLQKYIRTIDINLSRMVNFRNAGYHERCEHLDISIS